MKLLLSFLLFTPLLVCSQIISNPRDTAVCSSSNAFFKIRVTGSQTFCWQVNKGNGWININGNYPNANGFNSDSLSLVNINDSNNNDSFRCIVSNLYTSNNAMLIVYSRSIEPLKINSTADTICPGTNITLSLTGGKLGYLATWQWYLNSCNSSSIGSGSSIQVSPNSISQYFVKAIGYCNQTICKTIKITTLIKPELIKHPKNTSICSGQSTSISVAAIGSGINFQWQVNQGTGWSDITSSGNYPTYSNFNSSILNISNTTDSNNGYEYRVIIYGTCSPSVISNPAILYILKAPSITSNINNKTVCEGSSSDFQIYASGDSLSYQWQINDGSGWSDITNKTLYPTPTNFLTNKLTISNIMSWNNGYKFRCKITGYCTPIAYSDSANLFVNTIPNINQQPINDSICEKGFASFNLIASGTNINYKWQYLQNNNWNDFNGNLFKTKITNWNTNLILMHDVDSNFNRLPIRCNISNLGCKSINSIPIYLTVFKNPELYAGNDTNICIGENFIPNISLNGISPFQYNWSPTIGISNKSISNPSIRPTNNTEYKLIVTDKNGCSETDFILVNITPLPDITTNKDTSICEGQSINLISGGGVKYLWSPNVFIDNINISNPKIAPTRTIQYELEVENNYGCKAKKQINIYVNPRPIVKSNNDTFICSGQNIQLHANESLFYEWFPKQNLNFYNISNPIFNGNQNQTYVLKGTNIYGCSDYDTLNIGIKTLPIVDAGQNTSICYSDSIMLKANGAKSYFWSENFNKPIKGNEQPYVHPKNTTTYIVYGIDDFGCQAIDSIKVTVNNLPKIIAGKNTKICKGDTIRLHAEGGLKYKWESNAWINDTLSQSPITSPKNSSTYYLTGTDFNNCYSKDTIIINLEELPISHINGDTLICQNAKWVQFCNNKGNYNYKWGIKNGQILTSDSAMCIETSWPDSTFSGRIYSTIISRSFPYCQTKDSINIFSKISKSLNPAKIIAKSNNLSTGILICIDQNYQTINWGYESKINRKEYFISNNVSWCNYQKIDTSINYYWAYISNDTSCITKSYFNSPNISRSTQTTNIEISENIIFPNPGNGFYTIISNDNYKLIEIYNSIGQLIQTINSNEEKTTIDLSNESCCVYTFKIKSENIVKYYKVLKN